MRKRRLWVCKQCGRAWFRKRKDDTSTHYCCGQYAVKGRVFPKRKTSKRERLNAKIQKFNDGYLVKPRTSIGTVLRISRESLRAFKLCMKAKTRPALIRKANLFVESIGKDIHLYQTPKDSDKSWVKRIDKEGYIHRSKGGMTGVPIVKMSENDMGYTKGLYTRHFIMGVHSITLGCKEKIPDIKSTLIHETLHFIDANCEMSHRGHDHYWRVRLERFTKMLGQ